MSFRAVVCLSALVLVLECGGCAKNGGDTAHLAGKVTLDGQPIPADATAFITFQPSLDNTKAKPIAVPITNSAYDSPNSPIGSVSALFNINIPTGKKISTERGEVPEMDAVMLAPEQLSGIKLNIAGDNPNQDFDLRRGK